MRSTGGSRLIPKSYTQLNWPNLELSVQISIAKIGVQNQKDFELSENLD